MRDRAMNRYLDFSYRIEDFARNKHYCLAGKVRNQVRNSRCEIKFKISPITS